MRRWLLAIVLLCVAPLGIYFVSTRPHPSPNEQEFSPAQSGHALQPSPLVRNAAADQITNVASSAASDGKLPRTSPAAFEDPAGTPVVLPEPTVPEQELPQLPTATVLENLRTDFHQYQSKFGGNPVGTNLEITRALNGENSRQIRFLRMEDGMRVNSKGELIDTWGTPYFFHQLSGTEMEIHSAGPDKKMWTEDDLVIR